MKRFKKLGMMLLSALTAFGLALPSVVHADAEAGMTVVTLGKDLTITQQEQILQEMQVPADVKKIYVTNQEEHQYLGKYLSAATIGQRALSSAKITLTQPGKGISVKTHNITTITDSMYANAAITAGVKDADIYVTAPKPVSGTAALTGIIKAFEAATGQKIDETKKQVANEEIVRTSEVAQKIKDPNKAVQFMNRIKEEVSKQKPQTPEDYRNIIVNVSNEFNIHLDQQTTNQLVQFSQRFSKLDINWDAIKNQFSKLRGDISNIMNDKKTRSIIDDILQWLGDLFRSIGDFFTNSSSRHQQ